jgi:hypothetical protein
MNIKGLTPREEFLKASFILAKSAPMQWFDFLEALNGYCTFEIERGLQTTTDDSMIALGMSRRIVELRNDFRNIEQTARKLNLVA